MVDETPKVGKKTKLAAILAAVIAILGAVYAVVDGDPETQPNIDDVTDKVGDVFNEEATTDETP